MSVYKIAAWIPVSVEALEDGPRFNKAFHDWLRRITHPWEFPDRPAWRHTPALFPRFDRITRWMRRSEQ
ncbi:hypothetical protein [Ilumatobacter sp.]|uniref:hypothetical protein n=1 Tax=Ilumatobacter sp. TaxID=1967498 RepID=UPI0037534532